MLILALDTTTRAGSLALARDGRLLEIAEGDPGLTHAARLPGSILDALARHHLALADIDLYGVAVGPGSFTGLRIGIATIQGLAFAHARPVAGVSALDALAAAGGPGMPAAAGAPALRAAWMDAQRGEVYGRLFRADGGDWQPLTEPVVGRPAAVLDAWASQIAQIEVEFVGDGAVVYRAQLEERMGELAGVADVVPPLAPTIAVMAAREAAAGHAGHPEAIRPLYVRRPDAELARERKGQTQP